MKFLKNEKLILNLIKYGPILFVLIMSAFITLIFLKQQEKHLQDELTHSKEQFILKNKQRIKEEVDRVFILLNEEKKSFELHLKEEIKERVYEAHNIATLIYNSSSNKVNHNHSEKETFQTVKSTLNGMRFNKGRGYYFLFNQQGINLLHPLNKNFEGKNILNYPDAQGYNFAEKMVSTIKSKSEGFDTYYWYKNNNKSDMHKKISFFKYFEPLNIGIGTGEYVIDYEKELQQKLLSRIQKISYGKNGYVFVYDLKGVCLSHFKKELINVNRYNLQDAQGNFLVQNVLNFAKDNNNGYMSYIATMKPNSKVKNREKISYIRLFEDWNWVIGTGFYTDDFDNELLVIQNKLKLFSKNITEKILYTSFIITILFILISFVVSKIISNIFKEYRRNVDEEMAKNTSHRKKLEFQSLLLEQSLAATDVVNEDGKFIYVNDAYAQLWGYDNKEEILNTSPINHCVDEKMPEIIINKIEKDIEHIFQFKARKKDGNTFDALMAAKYIYLNEKKYYIGSTIDISQILLYEQELRDKDKQLIQQSKMATMGEMIGNISHQMKQPLSVISMYSTAAKVKKELNDLDEEYLYEALDGITANTQYLASTIDDFRDFFRPDNNQLHIFKISNTIEKTLKLMSAQFKTKNITLIQDIEDIEIKSAENALVQVLINILNNARDELIKKDDIKLLFINVYKNKDNLIIKILDNAGGVPEDLLNKIFDSYFTTKSKENGTGIGLYMSKDIVVNLLKGSLAVINKKYNYEDIDHKGAEFNIVLPIK